MAISRTWSLMASVKPCQSVPPSTQPRQLSRNPLYKRTSTRRAWQLVIRYIGFVDISMQRNRYVGWWRTSTQHIFWRDHVTNTHQRKIYFDNTHHSCHEHTSFSQHILGHTSFSRTYWCSFSPHIWLFAAHIYGIVRSYRLVDLSIYYKLVDL